MSSNYVSRKKEIYATNVHYEGTERTDIKKRDVQELKISHYLLFVLN